MATVLATHLEMRSTAVAHLVAGRSVAYVVDRHTDAVGEIRAIADRLGGLAARVSIGDLRMVETVTGGRLYVLVARGQAGRGVTADSLIVTCPISDRRREDLMPVVMGSPHPTVLGV